MGREQGKPGIAFRIVGWFLVLSYALGSPAFAFVELRTGMFSERFDLPPAFLYLVSGIQFTCSLTLFRRSIAPWSLAVLSVLSLGAVVSHFRIGSPLTSIPAVIYTALQVWFGYRQYRVDRDQAG